MKIFITNCNISCWQCNKVCEMKDFMEKTSEGNFNKQIIESLKANAGLRIMYGLSVEKANDFVVQTAVAFSIARKKYLETLQN